MFFFSRTPQKQEPSLWEEYNNRSKQAQYHHMDHQWFVETIQVISDGIFSCYGTGGHYLRQQKECEWATLYDLLSKLNSCTATIRIKVKPEDFSRIKKQYSMIEDAIAKGEIELYAHCLDSGVVELYEYLSEDYGDEDGYGHESVSLLAKRDKDGNYVFPFHAIGERSAL